MYCITSTQEKQFEWAKKIFGIFYFILQSLHWHCEFNIGYRENQEEKLNFFLELTMIPDSSLQTKKNLFELQTVRNFSFEAPLRAL